MRMHSLPPKWCATTNETSSVQMFPGETFYAEDVLLNKSASKTSTNIGDRVPPQFKGTPAEWLNMTTFFGNGFSGIVQNDQHLLLVGVPGFHGGMFDWLRGAVYAGKTTFAGEDLDKYVRSNRSCQTSHSPLHTYTLRSSPSTTIVTRTSLAIYPFFSAMRFVLSSPLSLCSLFHWLLHLIPSLLTLSHTLCTRRFSLLCTN